jgi:hypothetical protein
VGVRVKPVEADTDGVREVEREVAFDGDILLGVGVLKGDPFPVAELVGGMGDADGCVTSAALSRRQSGEPLSMYVVIVDAQPHEMLDSLSGDAVSCRNGKQPPPVPPPDPRCTY